MEMLRDLRVLVVDDNATNRRILHDVLVGWHMKPVLTEGGRAALDVLQEAEHGRQPFSLVLLDAQMPDMDGFAVADAIRHDPHLFGSMIVMLTSSGLRGDAARCRELGIEAYLTKPIRQADLLGAIRKVIGQQPRAEKRRLVTIHSVRESQRLLRVLVAEDNAVNRLLAVRLLEKRGHGSSSRPPARRRSKPWRASRSTSSSWTCRCPRWTASRPPSRSGSASGPAEVVSTSRSSR